MAKQKKLNKNLVAFLTVMGMVFVISVVSLVVMQQARRDPRVLAEGAQRSEKAGDLQEAAQRYWRAYEASKKRNETDTAYAVEAARCYFAMGDIPRWRSLLFVVSSELPGDRRVREAMLEGLWRMREIAGTMMPDLWRDSAEALLEIDPNNAWAMASLAQGKYEFQEPTAAEEADAHARKAFAMAPLDPRVAITYVGYLERQAMKERSAGVASGWRATKVDEFDRNTADQVAAILRDALAANPANVPLAIAYADFIRRQARLREREDREAAASLFGLARDALMNALAETEKNPSPELHLAIARHLYEDALRRYPEPTPEQRVELKPLLAEVEKHASRAIELDKAMYDAHTLRADLRLLESAADGTELPAEQRVDGALEILDAAKEATVTLRNVRAILRGEYRILLLRRAFDLGMTRWSLCRDNETAEKALARAETFLADARAKYPEHPLTHFMLGQFQVAKRDAVGAIECFETAAEKADQLPVDPLRYWLSFARVQRLPEEQLAVLYREREQYGEALRQANRAVKTYTDAGGTPPASLVLITAELLGQTGRDQEALDLIDRYRDVYGSDQQIRSVRIAILGRLGRVAEADQEAQLLRQELSGPEGKTWNLRRLLEAKEYDKATAALRELGPDTSIDLSQFQELLTRWSIALSKAERMNDVRGLIDEWRATPPREDAARFLEAMAIEVHADIGTQMTAEQRAELDARRREQIEKNPDPKGRALEYYRFYAARNETEKALEALKSVRQHFPDEIAWVEDEFYLRLRLEQLSEAGALISRLSQHEKGRGLDGAGGAVYRGDLALAQGKVDAAVTEYRQAIQMLPKTDELQLKLARAYLIGNRVAEAVDALNAAIEFNPNNFEACRILRELYRGQMAQAFGKERDQYKALAEEAQARAAKINPEHPIVLSWQTEATEERDPLSAIAVREKRRIDAPTDQENHRRLASLYLSAWAAEERTKDEARLRKLAADGARFFSEATRQADSAERQVALAQAATDFFIRSAQMQAGETLLRELIAARNDESKITFQLLLALFYEGLGRADLAESALQQAQNLIAQVTQDAEVRTGLQLQVGGSLVGFYQRQRNLPRTISACRWILERTAGRAGHEAELEQIRATLIQSLFSFSQVAEAESELRAYLGQKYAEKLNLRRREGKEIEPLALPGADFDPQDMLWLSLRAQLFLMKRDRDRALQDLGAILVKAPENIWALYSRGRLLLERGRNAEAREDLTRAVKLLPRSPEREPDVRLALATLYERMKQTDQAVEELRALLEAMDRLGMTMQARQPVITRLARILTQSNQFDKAARLISEYMEKHPNESVWPYELGRLYDQRARSQRRPEDQVRDCEQAAAYFQRGADTAGLQNVEEMATCVLARMASLTQARRPAEAIAEYQKFPFKQLAEAGVRTTLLTGVGARLAAEAADAFRVLGQPEMERKLWLQALTDASETHVSLTGELGTTLRKSWANQRSEVEALFRELIKNAPVESTPGQRLRIVLASVLIAFGQPANALPILSEVLPRLKQGTPEHLTGILTLAQAQDEAKDAAGCVRTYKEIIAAYPGNTTALNNLAYKLVTDETVLAPKEALQYAEQLRSLVAGEAESATVLDTVGWIYYQNEQYENAATILEEALALGGPNPAVCLHLGLAYKKLNRMSEARQLLNQGLELAKRENNQTYLPELEKAIESL